jgi:hypothetical protein
MRLNLSSEEKDRGRRGVLCARLAMAEAAGEAGWTQVERLRAELEAFDEEVRYRVVHSGRLPYRDSDREAEAAG